MMPLARPRRVMAGGLILAATVSGSARAQESVDLPPLSEAAPATPAPPPVVPAPTAGAIPLEPAAPPMVVGPPHHRSEGHHHIVHPPDRTDRQARRLWRRFHWQEHFLGYPEEFVARPLGASLYTNNRIQVANAEAAQMVLYNYDFVEGTDQLNLRGQDQLARIMERLPVTFAPVIVERTPRAPGLAETRRLAVLSQIARSPFPVPAERVVVGPPIALGLSGVEAELINSTFLSRTQQGGPPVSTGGGFAAGGGTGAGQ